jgi:hypothetical protein
MENQMIPVCSQFWRIVLLILLFSLIPLCAASNDSSAPIGVAPPLIIFEHLGEIKSSITDTAVDLVVHFVVSKKPEVDGPSIVHLSIEKPSCTCTTIQLDKDHFQSGDSGVLRVHFEIGQFHGLKVIDLTAHLNRDGAKPEQQSAIIELRIQVPLIVKIEPLHLEWTPQDGNTMKLMTFTAVDPTTALTTYDLSDSTFEIDSKRSIISAHQIVLAVRRVRSDRKSLCSINMRANVGNGKIRNSIGYLVSMPTVSK